MAGFSLMSSILDKTPYGGYRTGMADERAIMHSDRELLNQDLDNRRQQLANDEFEAGGPLRAAERAVKHAEAEKLKGEMDSGLWDEDRKRKRDMEIADLAAKISKEQLDTMKQKLSGTEAISQLFTPEMTPAEMAANWENARAIGKEYRLDIGDFNEQNAAKLQAQIKATPMAQKMTMDLLNHKQAIELENTRGQNRVYEVWTRDQGANARSAKAQEEATKRTQILADQRRDAAAARPIRVGATLEKARALLAQGPSGWKEMTETEVDMLEADYIRQSQSAAKGDLELTLAKLKSAGAKTPEEKQLLDQQVARLRRQVLPPGVAEKLEMAKKYAKKGGNAAPAGERVKVGSHKGQPIYKAADGTLELENGTKVNLK